MTITEAKEKLIALQKKIAKNKLYQYIKLNNLELFNFIESYYNWPKDTKSSTKIYWILNELTEIPKCIVCGKTLKINQFSKRTGKYVLHCSHYCGCHSTHARTAYKQTCLEKYGSEHNMKSVLGLKEYSNAIYQKYGTHFTFQNKQIHDKIKNTVQQKYGVNVVSKADKIKSKISDAHNKKTFVEKQQIISKIKHTKLTRYGNENYVNSAKAAATNKNKYNVANVFQMQHIKDKNAIASKVRSYNNIILKDVYDIPCFSLQEYIDRKSDNDYFEFECKKCHKKFLSKHHDGFHDHCQECYPKKANYEEKQLARYVRSITKNIIENIRTIIPPYELDIYIPEKNLAIEFDGLYWHSADVCKESPNYHLAKTQACEQKGIQLIHIFENEWLCKQDIVKSRLKNLLSVYDKTVYARKCVVKEVDSKTSKEFQEASHIQGAVNSKVNLGLYFENELVSLMTFGKCRFDKKHEWEMLRFCNKLNYHIPGGAGKLLKYFERNYNPKNLVSYADRRWSQGKLYKTLGFKLLHLSPPNYWYWKNTFNLESRVKYQKHKLKNILENFDNNKTEVENMKNNGYHRIFDCGNIVFEKIY